MSWGHIFRVENFRSQACCNIVFSALSHICLWSFFLSEKHVSSGGLASQAAHSVWNRSGCELSPSHDSTTAPSWPENTEHSSGWRVPREGLWALSWPQAWSLPEVLPFSSQLPQFRNLPAQGNWINNHFTGPVFSFLLTRAYCISWNLSQYWSTFLTS